VLSQSTKSTPESAEPTLLALTALEAPESAKLTFESVELTPAVPGASEVSSDDFATTVAALVGMEVPEVSDKEMVDYEPTPERVEVNVVVLSADYYIVADDSTAVEFNFAMESAVFQKADDSINHLKPLHVKRYINGTPVHSMLVDSGAIVNLMPLESRRLRMMAISIMQPTPPPIISQLARDSDLMARNTKMAMVSQRIAPSKKLRGRT